YVPEFRPARGIRDIAGGEFDRCRGETLRSYRLERPAFRDRGRVLMNGFANAGARQIDAPRTCAQRWRTRRQAAGFTLLEILVTLVILSFGLLGAAGLQMRMVAEDQEGFQRAQALLLVDDILNRISA